MNHPIVRLVGEKENPLREGRGGTAPAERYCMKLKVVCNLLIINEIVVEATGVELFSVLITRKLLIPGTATTAKKAPLPDPLYVYCAKMLSLWSPADQHSDHSIPYDAPGWIEKNAHVRLRIVLPESFDQLLTRS